MLPFKKALQSTVGKKFLMAASGVLLLGFIVFHLLENLALLSPDGSIYNTNVAFMKATLGPFLPVAELGLLGLFLAHIALALNLHLTTGKQRGVKYTAKRVTKGGESKFGFPANGMKISGAVIGAFLVGHIAVFRFGAGIENYDRTAGGLHDIYGVVAEQFTNPVVAIGYTIVMIFLAMHLRHGFWSIFQSFGAMAPKYSKLIYSIGLVFAALIAIGFILIPLRFFIGSL